MAKPCMGNTYKTYIPLQNHASAIHTHGEKSFQEYSLNGVCKFKVQKENAGGNTKNLRSLLSTQYLKN
jgi:hypothetical protein